MSRDIGYTPGIRTGGVLFFRLPQGSPWAAMAGAAFGGPFAGLGRCAARWGFEGVASAAPPTRPAVTDWLLGERSQGQMTGL